MTNQKAMAEAKHTPAIEWQASPNGAAFRRIEPAKGETLERRVEYLRNYKRGDGTNAYLIRCMVEQTPLIAAAPELLAIIERVAHDPCDTDDGCGYCISCMARAAFTKATGREA